MPCKALLIPHSHEAKPRAEVDRLVSIGFLTKVNDSTWRTPKWATPKKDNTTVSLLSDFRELTRFNENHILS